MPGRRSAHLLFLVWGLFLSHILIAQPANDDPCGAESVSVNSSCTVQTFNYPSSTTQSTDDPDDGTCYSSYSSSVDVWLSVVIPTEGGVTIEFEELDNMNGTASIYSGTDCNSLSNLFCSFDGSTLAGSSDMPGFTITGNPGDTFYIQYWDVNGNEFGDFGVCATPFTPASNDSPCTAEVLNVNSTCQFTSGSLTGATFSGIDDGSSCGSYNGNDVWYQLTIPPSGAVNISTQAGTATDLDMAIYEGSCSNIGYFNSCDDSGSSQPGSPDMPEINFTGIQTTTIFIQVWDPNGGEDGDFSICATEVFPPSNDEPCSAETLPVNSNCQFSSGSIDIASQSGEDPPGCGSYSGGDIWYELTVPSSGIVNISTQAGSFTNADMAIYTGACSSLNYEECDASSSTQSGSPSMPELIYSGTPGESLFVQIYDPQGSQIGDFSICATEVPSATNNLPCDAIGLAVNETCQLQTYTNMGASDSGLPDPGCDSYQGGDLWFTADVPADGNLWVTMDRPSGSEIVNMGLAFYSGSCSSLTLDDCHSGDSPYNSLYPVGLYQGSPGETVFIRVWDFGADDVGTFQICARESAEYDEPCGAIPLGVGEDNYCEFATAQNLFTGPSATLPDPSCGDFSDGDWWYVTAFPPSGDLTIRTNPGSLTNTDMAVYSGTCDNLTLVACNTSSGPGAMPEISLNGSEGAPIYIRFSNPSGDYGDYQLCATESNEPQEDCSGASKVCADFLMVQDPDGIGDGNDLNSSNEGCISASSATHQLWYAFQPSTSGTIAFTIDNNSGNTDDIDFAVWGPMSSLQCPPIGDPERCNWDPTSNTTGLNSSGTTSGFDSDINVDSDDTQDYYILMVDNYDNGPLDATFQFTGTCSFECPVVLDVLPVEWLTFSGTDEGEFNRLRWATGSEKNSSHFVVQHRQSGSWKAIGQVSAAGDSQHEINYYFDHPHPPAGENIYRLKQVDLNGEFTFSSKISITNNRAAGELEVNVSPNPTSGMIRITLHGADRGLLNIRLIDLRGTAVSNWQTPGDRSVQLDLSSFAAGSYFLRVTHRITGRSSVTKVVKQ